VGISGGRYYGVRLVKSRLEDDRPPSQVLPCVGWLEKRCRKDTMAGNTGKSAAGEARPPPPRQQPTADRGIQIVTTRELTAAARAGTVLAELVVSFGGYYLLRALGVEVFWALLAPAIAVGGIGIVTTGRRRCVDLVGAMVLAELTVTICVSLGTGSARIGALFNSGRGPAVSGG
jgi:hypothetical protein